MSATVWTDGSCVTGRAGDRCPGGWAAIVERGSDGWALRGRDPTTTSVRMELVAAIQGLRALPGGEAVLLRTDCTAIIGVYYRWKEGTLPRNRRLPRRDARLHLPRDADLWEDLGCEFDRLLVAIEVVRRRELDPVHRRAHVMAQAEARGMAAELYGKPPPARERRKLRRHSRDCTSAFCVEGCPTRAERSAER